MTTASVPILQRTCRRFGLDRNPMRRREDRVQLCAGAVLALLFLLTVPLLAILIGGRVYQAETRASEAEVARLHRVSATVVEVDKAPLYAPVSGARVSWSDGTGTHTGDYRSTGLLQNGATVDIWLDGSGRIIEPPPADRPLSKAILLTGAAQAAVLACLAGGFLLLRRRLDRRRYQLWEAEWAITESAWRRRGFPSDQP